MRINIKPQDCKYVVNEEKREVRCYYDNPNDLFIDLFLSIHKDRPSVATIMPEFLTNPPFMDNRFVGVAKCAPTDKFDPKIGKLIAYSRMKDKLCKSFFKAASKFFYGVDQELDHIVDVINIIGDRWGRNKERRDRKIEELRRKMGQ